MIAPRRVRAVQPKCTEVSFDDLPGAAFCFPDTFTASTATVFVPLSTAFSACSDTTPTPEYCRSIRTEYYTFMGCASCGDIEQDLLQGVTQCGGVAAAQATCASGAGAGAATDGTAAVFAAGDPGSLGDSTSTIITDGSGGSPALPGVPPLSIPPVGDFDVDIPPVGVPPLGAGDFDVDIPPVDLPPLGDFDVDIPPLAASPLAVGDLDIGVPPGGLDFGADDFASALRRSPAEGRDIESCFELCFELCADLWVDLCLDQYFDSFGPGPGQWSQCAQPHTTLTIAPVITSTHGT